MRATLFHIPCVGMCELCFDVCVVCVCVCVCEREKEFMT